MNAKRIGARLIVSTMAVGAVMSVAAPAWAVTDDTTATPDATLLGVQDSFCEAVEENGGGVNIMDIEVIESYRKLGSLPASPQVSGVMTRVSDKTHR